MDTDESAPASTTPGATTPETPHRPIVVAISEMPAPPTKALFRDSTRLLSLAAFIFSVTTGLFAGYQSWRNDRYVIVDRVSKLMDDYYSKQDTLSRLNTQTQMGFINLLRSELRSTAARTIPYALRVQSDLDDGTWQALGQINDAEGNFAAAERAWLASLHATNDINIYAIGLRSLGVDAQRQGKTQEADGYFRRALQLISSDQSDEFQGKNTIPPVFRAIQNAMTHRMWLYFHTDNVCGHLVEHFDAAQEQLSKIDVRSQTDPTVQAAFQGEQQALNQLLPARSACPGNKPVANVTTLFCIETETLIGSATINFINYRSDVHNDFMGYRSILDYEGSECWIDDDNFNCTWPDKDATAIRNRKDILLASLAACRDLGTTIKDTHHNEQENRSVDSTNIETAFGPRISLREVVRKPEGTGELRIEFSK